MNSNLPPVLPIGKNLGLSRSQNLPRPSTKVSISDSVGKRAVSSVSNLRDSASSSLSSGPSGARSSISRPVEDPNQRQADDLRYNYVRSLIRKRQKMEAKEKGARQTEKSVLEFGVKNKVGEILTTKKIMKKLYLLKKKNPVTFSPLEKEHMSKIIGEIKEHGKYVKPGYGFARSARVKMKNKIETWHEKGEFSKIQSNLAKEIIDELPH